MIDIKVPQTWMDKSKDIKTYRIFCTFSIKCSCINYFTPMFVSYHYSINLNLPVMQIIFVSQLLDYGYNKLLILLNTKILGEISVFVHWKGARNAFCQVFKKKKQKRKTPTYHVCTQTYHPNLTCWAKKTDSGTLCLDLLSCCDPSTVVKEGGTVTIGGGDTQFFLVKMERVSNISHSLL